ncbi:MAG TPA: cation:proton antiporter [Thermoplasmata archaeon]
MAGTEAIYEQLTILLVVATLGHFAIKRLHQPTMVGEIAVGILLGPTVVGNAALGPYRFVFDQTLVVTFAALGAIFLLFLIGLESDFRAIYTKRNSIVAAGGVVLPFVFGALTAYFMVPTSEVGTNASQFLMAIFVGATLTATSVAIAAAVLLDLGLMREPVAKTILGAAVVDDILGLAVLSLVVGASRGQVDPLSIGVLVGTAVLFLGVGLAVGLYLFSRIVVRVQAEATKLGLRHGGFIAAVAVTFLYAFVAELIGLSAVVGAFLAGAMFANTPLREDFTEGAGYLGAIFTPIFFISLGLQVDLPAAVRDPSLFLFGLVLAVVAILTKVVGCGFAARLSKMSRPESLAVGWGMTPRGEVGLIVALAALTASVISQALFSVIVVVMVLVSVVPAPVFKRALAAVDRERQRAKSAEAPSSDPP